MNRFLLVGRSRQSALKSFATHRTKAKPISWRNVLEAAIKPLGELAVCQEADALTELKTGSYRVVLVDASAVNHLDELVFRLRGEFQSLPIIVATAAPTWQSAREVFLSGATDYIHKSADIKKLSEYLFGIMELTPAITPSSTGRANHG